MPGQRRPPTTGRLNSTVRPSKSMSRAVLKKLHRLIKISDFGPAHRSAAQGPIRKPDAADCDGRLCAFRPRELSARRSLSGVADTDVR